MTARTVTVRTVLRRLLSATFAVAVVTAITASAWLLTTTEGLRWSLAQAQARLPALQLDGVDGSWLRGLDLQRLQWRDDTLAIDLEALRLRWRPSALFAAHLDVDLLHAQHLRVQLFEDDTAPPAAPGDLSLPDLALPGALLLRELRLDHVEFVNAGTTALQLQDIQLAGRWWRHQLRIHSLELRHELARARLSGQLQLRGDYPLQADLLVTLNEAVEALSPEPLQLSLHATGDLRDLALDAALAPSPQARLRARLSPVVAGLPFEAELTLAAPLQEPLPEGVALQQLQVDLRGDLDNIELDARLQALSPWGDATLATQCGIAPGAADWRCRGQLSGALAARDGIPLQGPLTLALAASGNWGDGPLLDLDISELQGQAGEHPIRGALSLHSADGTHWLLRELALHAGPNTLEAAGELGEHSDLRLQLHWPEPGILAPGLTGLAHADLTLSGSLSAPSLRGAVQLRDIVYQQQRLDRADITANLRELGRADSELSLVVSGLQQEDLPALDGQLRLSGTLAAMQLHSEWNARDTASAALGCRLALDTEQWQAHCADLDLAWLGTPPLTASLLQPLALIWQPQPQHLQLAPFCLAIDHAGDRSSDRSGARACLSQALDMEAGQLGELAVDIDDLPLAWAQATLPPELQLDPDSLLQARLHVTSLAPMALRLSVAIPRLAATLHLDDPQLDDPHLDDPQLDKEQRELAYRDITLQGQWQDEVLALHLAADSDALGQLAANLRIQDPREQRRLDGELRLSALQLEAISWVAPDIERLQGRLDGTLNLSGSLSQPGIDGDITLSEGLLVTPMLRDSIRPLEAQLRFARNRAELQAQFQAGDGSGSLQGQMQWQDLGDDWRGSLRARIERLVLQPLPDSTVAVSPDFTFEFAPGQVSVDGELRIDEADIHIRELPAGTANVSADARIAGEEPAAPGWQVRARSRIELGPSFRFRGFGADAWLSGHIDARYESGSLARGDGEVTIDRGRYRAYGQRLLVRRGSFIFNGPLDNPDLDFEAIREMPPGNDLEAGLQVRGSLRNPQAQLFSRPAMPEGHIAYVILTGREPGPREGEAMTAESALLSLGIAGGGGQAAELAQRFGITDFQIEAVTASDGAEAQLSGYLSPRLYVRYGVGMGQRANSLTLQYRLTQRLLVEAVSGLDNALDLIYAFERR